MQSRKYGFLAACSLSAIYIGAVNFSYAQDEDYFNIPVEQLVNAEIVSASKKPERLMDAAAAVFVITSEDIRRSGVRTIPDALRMAPGVQVAQADANSWAVSIRGFNGVLANKLLVMIDGRTVYNPLFAGTYWELQDMVLDDIDRIEVVRGPGGTLWGANAVNGVINIITKHTSETIGNYITGVYGDEEKGTVSARHGGNLGGDAFYRMYGTYYGHDSSRAINGDNAQDEWWSGRTGFRADWDDDFTLQGDVYRVLDNQLNSTPQVGVPGNAIIAEENMESQGANILGRYKQDYAEGALLTIQSYLDYTSRDQILLEDQRVMYDFDAQYNFAPSGSHEFTAGAGYRFMHDELEGSPSVEFSPSGRDDHLFSTFVQDKITLHPDRWYLTLGSKFEHNDYSGFEIQPNARLQFFPDLTQTVWASISRAVRTPSRLEHDLDQTITVLSPATEVILQGNRDFDSEELIAYELGYRKQLNADLSFDVATFYNDYDQLSTVGFLPATAGVFPIEAVNGMTAETYGIEIASSWNVNSDFKLSAGYSFLHVDLHVADNNGFDLETGEGTSPQHQANARASWNVTDDVTFNTSAYYVDQLSTDDVDDYVRLDMNLEYEINENLHFNLVGQNLLDDAHREFSSPLSLNAAEVERSVFGKLTWQF